MEQAALVVQETIINEAPYQVGDKIAQLVWVKFPTVNTTRVKAKDKLSKTERGAGGFGSTGK
jgi:dUTPase